MKLVWRDQNYANAFCTGTDTSLLPPPTDLPAPGLCFLLSLGFPKQNCALHSLCHQVRLAIIFTANWLNKKPGQKSCSVFQPFFAHVENENSQFIVFENIPTDFSMDIAHFVLSYL